MRHLFISAVLVTLIGGCKTFKTKYPYSLSDFNPALRMRLEKIVQNGGLCDIDTYSSDENNEPEYYDYLTTKTSAKDLYKLINCEHPVLRAFAFACLIRKEDSTTNRILLDHLDDTAIITRCMGEFGESYTYVSDYFISQSERNTAILKSHLSDTVIKNYSYLSYAYFFIGDLENPDEKYYPIIKQMAENPKGIHTTEKETIALRALAKYKKRSDIPFIAEKLSNNWRLSEYNYDSCFSIIVNNPDTAYFKIIERFYRMISRPQSREELQTGFLTGYFKLGEKYDSFLAALISFRNKASSRMTDTILKKALYPFNPSKGENYRYLIYKLLKKNECPEYKRLIKLLEPEAMSIEKEQARYQFPPMEVTIDTLPGRRHDPRNW